MSTGVPNLGNIKRSSSGGRKPHSPSQLHGHAQYAEGVVEETIGHMTHSPSWSEAGTENKVAGVAEMRAAKEKSDKSLREDYQHRKPEVLKSEGKTQNILGKVVGCEGMEERGEEKVHTGERLKNARDSV